MIKYSVGIDISSEEFYACVSTIDKGQRVKVKATRKFANTMTGFNHFNEWVIKNHKHKEIPLFFCMEATGVYHEQCALYLHEKGYNVSIILPNRAKQYLNSVGLKSKNDKIDARGLAQMGAEQVLDLWQPMGAYFYRLRTLTRQQQSLQETKTRYCNQLHAINHSMYQDELILDQLSDSIRHIKRQIKSIEKAIITHIEQDATVYRKVVNICKVKGLGVLTVAVILAETNGFALFKNKRQLVSYAGYDVIENQSGKHVGKTRISKKGNSRIRRILHLPAFSVVQYKQRPFIQLYERTLQKHRKKMKSYVAVQKKLLVIIYSLWKKDVAYDPQFGIEKSKNENENTGEQEQKPSSQSSFVEADWNDKKVASVNTDATQGRHTVELSQFASSQ